MKTLIAAIFFFFSFFPVLAQQPVLKMPTAHTGMINGFDVSHNGKYIVTGSVDFSIKLWDYRTKKELKVFTGHTGSVNTVCFSPNDSLLLSGSNDTKIKIWRVSTGECIATVDSLFNRMVNDVCFSDDGKLIAGCSSNSIGVWDIQAKKIIGDFNLSGIGKKIKFFPDNKKLACTESDSSFSVWSLVDTAAYIEKESFNYVHGNINDFFITADGKTMFAAVNTTINNIRIHLIGGKDTIRLNGHKNPARAICAGENDDVFYSMSTMDNPQKFRDDIEIKRWSIASRKCIDSFYFNDDANSILVNKIKLTPQNDLAISNYQAVFFARNNTVDKKNTITSRTSITNGILKNDSLFIFTAEDGIIRFFNTSNNSLQAQSTNSDFVSASFLNKNSVSIIQRNRNIKNYSSYILRYNLTNDQKDTLVKEPNAYIHFKPGLNMTDDGSRLAYRLIPVIDGKFLNDSARFKVWNTATKEIIRNTGALGINSFKFLPDNKSYVLCSGYSNKLFLYRDTVGTVYSDSVVGKYDIYANLAVIDSNHIICSDNEGVSIWNLATKKIEHKIKIFEKAGVYINPIFIKLSNKRDKLLLAQNDTVRLVDLSSRIVLQTFSTGLGWVNEMSFSDDGKTIITANIDNSIRVWDVSTGKEKYKIIFIDTADWIIVSPQGYYQCTPAAAKLLHYATKEYKIITFEQLDIKYNRPDKVLEAMENKDSILIKSYKKAYEKRVKKMGIDTLAFRSGYSVPEADFANRDAIEYEQKKGKIILKIHGSGNIYKLDRFNVWVNEVPVYGQRGISIRRRNRNDFDTTITIKLSQGENNIETSITNVNGTESYRMPLTVNYTPTIKQKETIRFIGIGIDKFVDKQYNLQYSSKDIRDLSKKLKEKYGNDIIIDTLFNKSVTVNNVKALKKRLLQTTENDKVIIAYSGHGMLSKDYDYYLSTYAVNFNKPEQNGLPYEELENLLDSIPARKKLLLIDACHSGEVDKEDLIRLKASSDSLIKGVEPVAYKQEGRIGLKNSFELMQSLFVNVGKSTGATIISAAAGTQFALERNDLKNGVFTFSILEAMNNYPTLKISELKKIVGERVEQITKGLQKPTSRNETIAVDWSIW